MNSLNQVLKICWSIVSKTADEKTRLQALTLINDCTGHKVDLSTNGIVITDAIKYVNEKVDHLNTEEKWLLQDIKEDKVKEHEDSEEQKTTNVTF